MKDIIVLLLFGFFTRVDASHYFVIGPNPMRFQHDETVLVSVFEETNYAVKVWLEHNGKNISEKNVVVPNERDPQHITMRVNEEDIFDIDTKEKPRTIKLVASDSSNVRKEVELVLSYNVGYLIVQTDKPIYTPQQEVHVRTLTLDESMKQAETWDVSMDIISPSNLTMGRVRRSKEQAKNKAFFKHAFTLPPHPEIGTWTILTKYGIQLETKSRALFKVQEYVLPTFGVEIRVDAAYIDKRTQEIKVEVKAKYVYGKPVQGKVGLSLFLRNRQDGSRDEVMKMKRKRLQLEGLYEFIVPVADIINSPLRDRQDFPNGCHLEIVADVIESSTGNEELASHESTVFAIEPYALKFTRSMRNFRPGREYYLKINMLLVNGDVAKDKDITVKVLDDNIVIATLNETTDENGQAIIYYTIQEQRETQFEASYGNVTSERHTVRPYIGKNQIQVEQVVEKGKHTVRAFTNMDTERGSYSGLLFVIVSRGKIVFTKFEESTQKKSNNLNDDLLEEIAPNARLLVFYVDKQTNQLVADSIKFDVEAKCRGKGLTLTTAAKESVIPGHLGQLTITGSPFMAVGLNVMDKALLLLNRENVMRKSKMFRELENHDRGCGEGSGANVEDVFRNAGLTVVSNAAIIFDNLKRNSEECDEKTRRKRSIECSANENCCYQGTEYAEKLLDEHGQDLDAQTLCYARAKWLADGGKLPVKCIVAFYRKCTSTISGFLSDVRAESRSDVSESDYEIDIQDLMNRPRVRSDFRESWLFVEDVLDVNGELSMPLRFPHSITEWMIQAIGITKDHGICISEPKNITAFRDFFIQLELPYKAVRLEQIDVKATIFNYGLPGPGQEYKQVLRVEDKQASIYLLGRADVCSNTLPGQQSPKTMITLPPNSAQTVTFPIVPLKNGYFEITVSAIVTKVGISTTDSIEKKLYVVNEGVEQTNAIHLCLDPLKQLEDCQDSNEVQSEWPVIDLPKQLLKLNLSIPLKSIPDTGSATAYISSNIMDDVISTLVNGADKLIFQPYGCGEQAMMCLAPTVYAMTYLKQTNNVTGAIEHMGNKYIRDGVKRALTYRHPDGSYSAYLTTPPSTWLTAFVAKVFCQAKNIVDDAVDEDQHIEQAINWVTTKQTADGSFFDSRPVIMRSMIGQLSEDDPSLTAFVLISMAECQSRAGVEDSMNKAIKYIEGLDREMLKNNSYLLAISTYALGLTKSGNRSEFKTLLHEIKQTEGKNIYWGNPATAGSIETTAYALLATMMFDDFKTSAYVVRWLTSQRNVLGSFYTTQSSVIGLQALSQYSIRTYSRDVDLKLQLLSEGWAQSGNTVLITNENSQLQQIVKNLPMTDLIVEVTGTGTGRMVIDLRYNIPSKPDEICPFRLSIVEIGEVNEHIDVHLFPEKKCDICGNCEGDPIGNIDYEDDNFVPPEDEPKANSNFGRKKRQAGKSRGERATKPKKCMKFNVRSKSAKEYGMSIVHVGLETGMKVVESDLKKLENENIISSYEMPENEKGFIIFYVDKIGPAPIPFIFRLIDEFEGDINTRKSAMVHVYDYYNPEQQCKTFYGTGPNKGQPVEYECGNSELKTGCKCAQTTCAQPWKHKLTKRHKVRPVIRLFHYMCNPDKANYGIRVIINSVEPDVDKQIITASATVQQVYNQGIQKLEPESELDFFWKMNCPHPKLEDGKVYYIFARDGNTFKDEEGNTVYRYPLMDTAIILEKPSNDGADLRYKRIMTNFERMPKVCSQ